ncbi:MAG TPA: hypothetical protein VGV90_16205, partial [Solirubrobacteraceae bacterium]|nr:hypothetical protein [Solirubrobacteraceae bacterium]
MPAITEVTAGGIRSGEPEALAGLCKRRGGAVLVYSEHVAPGQAGHAAADAFAQFRARVATADESSLDAESILLSATRHAAAARGASSRRGADGYSECPAAALLVGWIEDTLPAAEREHFEQHVVSCSACVDAVARFEAAERAYEHPPEAPLPASIARQIVGALVAAAPVTALDGDVAAVREAAEKGVGADISRPGQAPMQAPVPAGTDFDWSADAQGPAVAQSGASRPSPLSAPVGAAPYGRASAISRAREHGKDTGAAVRERVQVLGERSRRVRERGPGRGAAVRERVQVLGERGRRALERRPRFESRLPRFTHGMDRRHVLGIALAGLVALVTALALFIPGDSSDPGQSASSPSGESPTPIAGSPGALQDEPPAAAPKKPAR